MKKKIQKRREFFKITAQKALPIIGLLSIAKIPLFGQILNDGALDCNGSCYQTCAGTARGMCDTCSHQCIGGCEGNTRDIPQDTILSKNDTISKDNNDCNDGCKSECLVTCNSFCHQQCKGSCRGYCIYCCKGDCGATCTSCKGSCYGNCMNHVD